MKIKSVAGICRKRKTAYLLERTVDYGETVVQYVMEGTAIYAVAGLPRLNKEGLLTLLDVPLDKREEWNVQVDTPVPTGIDLGDDAPEDEYLNTYLPCIVRDGRVMQPMITERGEVLLVDRALMRPLEDEEEDITYFARPSLSGLYKYVVAKSGFFMVALLMPCVYRNNDLRNELKTIYNGLPESEEKDADLSC